jgi:hypothetical protein
MRWRCKHAKTFVAILLTGSATSLLSGIDC